MEPWGTWGAGISTLYTGKPYTFIPVIASSRCNCEFFEKVRILLFIGTLEGYLIPPPNYSWKQTSSVLLIVSFSSFGGISSPLRLQYQNMKAFKSYAYVISFFHISWLFLSPPTRQQVPRYYSATPPPQRPPTFFGKIIENLREEMTRNQKLKESLKEFRKDMDKLEQSEALQKVRYCPRVTEKKIL